MVNELPKRKNMRLTEFNYGKAGYYFVTICSKDKRCVFGKVVGGDAHIAPHVELSRIGKTADKFIGSIPGIDKYCVMPNHIHMIIAVENGEDGAMWASPPTKPLPTLVRSFKTLVSKELGMSVFQRSFYDHVIRNEEDYLRIWRYIDDNPAKWADDEYFRDGLANGGFCAII